MKSLKTHQSGFTLIELIAVIVILGILSAVAVPQFTDLQDTARGGVAEGYAGALASASVMNNAVNLAENAGVGAANPTDIATCAALVGLLDSPLEAGYELDSTLAADLAAAMGAQVGACRVCYDQDDDAVADNGGAPDGDCDDADDITATFTAYAAASGNLNL